MKEEVQAALDMVRPQLQADGGDAELARLLVRARSGKSVAAVKDLLM